MSDKIQDPAREAVNTVIDILQKFVPKVLEDFKIMDTNFSIVIDRLERLESEITITQRDTKLIPEILSILNNDGQEFAKIVQRVKKLEN